MCRAVAGTSVCSRIRGGQVSKTKPLVYSCSGCSSKAQMANHLALKLDRDEVAEMSCIAGVGGGVAGLVCAKQRPILALDGCVLVIFTSCLAQAGVIAVAHRVIRSRREEQARRL